MWAQVDHAQADDEDREGPNPRGGDCMQEICVEVHNDHLERMTSVPKPILAVAELIWNGLDADASEVTVNLSRNKLNGLQQIAVADDGSGIRYAEAVPAFKNLGGSMKRGQGRSKGKRCLHGSAGKGRFKAFFLGKSVVWDTCYEDGNDRLQYRIEGQRSNLGTFRLTDPAPAKGRSIGTFVRISDIERNFRSLDTPSATIEMAGHFALYLRQYPDVKIIYDGEKVDPASVEERLSEYILEGIKTPDGTPVKASLTIIEWKCPVDRALYLCDDHSSTLSEVPPSIQAPGFNFTAYLKSGLIRRLDEKGALSFAEELQPELAAILGPAREKLKEHFRKRAAEQAAVMVEEWKSEDVYPYRGVAKSWVETTERQVFDVLALNVHEYLPDFQKSDPKSRRFSFRLLKQALEKSPRELQRIFQEVLDLPDEKREELADLLERTSLSAIINASKMVADRLDFLKGLEVLVFHPDSKQQLKERTQLHRMLAENTWIFGDEFTLTVDDQSLTEVLRKHLDMLGLEETRVGPRSSA